MGRYTLKQLLPSSQENTAQEPLRLFEGLFLASGFHTDKLTSYNTPTSLLNLTGKVKIGRLYNDVYLYIRKSTKKLLS